MDRKNLRALTWRLHRVGRSITWPAALAIVLLAFEAAFYLSAVVPMLDERTRLRAQVLSQHTLTAQVLQVGQVNTDPRIDLAQFYAALGRPTNAPDLLRRLYFNAEDQGLVLLQAEYRPVPDLEGKLVRYQILLPAKGTYPEIRRFLSQASREVPGLAIDGINFQRQQIGEPVLDAQIKLTLFLSTSS